MPFESYPTQAKSALAPKGAPGVLDPPRPQSVVPADDGHDMVRHLEANPNPWLVVELPGCGVLGLGGRCIARPRLVCYVPIGASRDLVALNHDPVANGTE
jgi:hypothetical protein